MRVALHTRTISPHQLPLAQAIARRIGSENYRYVYSEALSPERKAIGWREMAEGVPCVVADDPETREWIETCDVLVTSFRDCDLIERRAKRGLKTWYCNERWFKPIPLFDCLIGVTVPGWVRMAVPGYRKMARRFVGLVNEHDCVGILAIGPWAKGDFLQLGVRKEKIVGWGYFVAPSDENKAKVENEQRKDSILKVLWAGRDISWKRSKDIVRAVALANKNLSTFQPSNSSTFQLTKLTGVKSDEVRKAMREHDVFVLASTAQEGWGAVVSEALEEGLNVIGTFEAGASAAILPKERLYHAGDVKALAKLLERERCGELPPCSIGEWTAEKAAERLLGFEGLKV